MAPVYITPFWYEISAKNGCDTICFFFLLPWLGGWHPTLNGDGSAHSAGPARFARVFSGRWRIPSQLLCQLREFRPLPAHLAPVVLPSRSYGTSSGIGQGGRGFERYVIPCTGPGTYLLMEVLGDPIGWIVNAWAWRYRHFWGDIWFHQYRDMRAMLVESKILW